MGISSFSKQTVSAGLAAAIPAGVISQFAGATAPDGYLLCQGQEVSISSHPSLHAVLGTTYGSLTNGSGGAGSTHFRIPNFQGRVPIGVGTAPSGNGVAAKSLAATGGDESVILSSAQIPAHSHPNTATFSGNAGTTGNDSPDHGHGPSANAFALWTGDVVTAAGPGGVNLPSGVGLSSNTAGANARHAHSFIPSGSVTMSNANNTGGGGAHANLQPYIVVNYIIKT